MLVTKREAKQASKKLLSVLLAVIMIMTSMSVCFGTVAMAASGTPTAAQWSPLLDALAAPTIKDTAVTFNGSANNYTVEDPDGTILDAVKAYYDVFKVLANTNPGTNATPSTGTADTSSTLSSTYNTINQVNAAILDYVSKNMSGYTANVGSFITGLLVGANVTAKGSQQTTGAQTTNDTNPKPSDLGNVADAVLTVVSNSALTSYTLSDLPDNVVTETIFTVSHKGDKYDYVYDYTAKVNGNGCTTSDQPAKYEHKYTYFNYVSAVTESAGASQSTAAIKAAETELKKYADYFDMTLEELVATDAETLDEVKTAITAAKKSVLDAKFTETIFNHFFEADYDVAALSANIDTAKSIQETGKIALYLYNLKEAGYQDIATDKAALISHANDIKANLDAYKAATPAVRTYIENLEDNGKKFVPSEIETYLNQVNREIELIEVREVVEEVRNGIVPFLTYSEDGIDEGTVTTEMLAAALTTVSGYKTRLGKYNTADIEAVAGTEFLPGITALSNQLDDLKVVAGYNDEFSREYAKFAADIFSVTDKNGDIDTLLSALREYDSWYTGLKSLINEMKTVLGDDLAEKLFDDLNDVMTARMDDAYVALNALLEAQINTAYDLFNAYTSAYGEKVNMASVSEYNAMQASIGLINVDAYNFLKEETSNFSISADAVSKYNAMQKKFPQYEEFLNSHGFATFETNTVDDLVREDTALDIARKNDDIDNDGIGEYKTSDEDIEKIISNLDALLQNDQIKKLLGDLINKDKETGEPTGEPFDLGALINGLIEGIYSDSLINTIVQYVYPIVCKEFAKVWAGLPATFTALGVETGVSLAPTADVKDCPLYLDDVEKAIGAVGIYLSPVKLAENLKNNSAYSGYTQVIAKLESATTKAQYSLNGDGDDDDTFVNPWEDANLFKNVYDEETGDQIFNDDGTPKQVYDLVWGVDEADDKKAAFIDAACAALSGLEPLLLSILSNKAYENPDTTPNSDARGSKIGTGKGTATVKALGFLSLDLTLNIDPITLVFQCSANDGWDNALVPIFEALGLKNIPHSEDLTTTRKILEDGLFAMIDQLIAQVAADPVTFILEALPNLAYGIEGGLVKPLLGMLKTDISYYADAAYTGTLGDNQLAASVLKEAMKSEEPIKINIGEMIDLEDMGLDISSFRAIWDMLADSVELLADLSCPNAGYIATLGKLVEKDTNRSAKTYTGGTNGKAYHIEANKADVLLYLIDYVLSSGLLDTLVENPEGFVADLLTNIKNNPDTVLAAVVELLNQKEYDTLRKFEWFEGFINGENVLGNSANEIYLNPGNDWTKEKADYLYNNIDSIVSAILTLAKLDLNKDTEEIDSDLGAFLGTKIDSLLSDKTLTALAALLAKLDLNTLLNKKEEGGEAETVAEGSEGGEGEAVAAPAIDINALVKEFLGIDLAAIAAEYADIAAAKEADKEYVYAFGVDAGTTTFAAVLTDMLSPLGKVLDFILEGADLDITLDKDNKVTLIGYNGYNNAIIPLLEALGCDVKALGENEDALTVIINALLSKIDELTEGDTIKGIIDILPGVLYFITSKGLSVSVRNLLQPVYVILDTIRPIYDLNLNETINGLLPDDFGMSINIDDIGLDVVFALIAKLLPDLDLSALKDVIYDVCGEVGTEYDSASDLQNNWKRGELTESFDGADLLTVVLSFVLEWATVEKNAKALDEMLGTDGIIASLNTVFESVEIAYGTPDWMYWFETEEEFNSYVEGNTTLPNTLAALTYPNDWTEDTAEYMAENLSKLVDLVVGLINKDKQDAPKTLAELLGTLDLFTTENLDKLVAAITGLLEKVDLKLIEAAGVLLDVNIVGLKAYKAPEGITTVDAFAAELTKILTTYADGLVNWLFFGDDFRFAKKSDNTDTIVINGGLGYEKGLALVLEALGCKLPEKATVETVIGSLASRIEEIFKSPVNEVLDILPNLVYFLNANGASVAVDNILQPVYALLKKLEGFGVKINLAELLGFDIKYLSLDDILTLVESKTGLDLTVAKEILVDFCLGKIEKSTYIYKMVAERKDTVTVVLTTALLLVKNEENAKALDEMLDAEIVSALDEVFASAPVTYSSIDWDYCYDQDKLIADGQLKDGAIIDVMDYAITYPNNWTEESALYVAENIGAIVDEIVATATDYDSVSALVKEKVNIYTPEILEAIKKVIADLIGGLDGNLKEIVDVVLGVSDDLLGADINGLLDYDVSGVKDKKTFIAALTGMLMEIDGLVEWLLLGENYAFFVDDVNKDGKYNKGEDIITINGGEGYAEGLALVLEALGCENLPAAYETDATTEEIVKGVLTSVCNRLDEILADPVSEVVDILPNVLYFLNANGVAVAVDNLLGAVNALLTKLKTFGLEVDINELVNIEELCKIEKDLTISLDNLSLYAVLELVSELVGLDLTKITDVLVGYALGEIEVNADSVSRYVQRNRMYCPDLESKADMLTVVVTAAIITLTDEANAEKVKSLLGENTYQLVLNLLNMAEVPVQEFSWLLTDRVGETFSAFDTSVIFEDFEYGMMYTKEKEQYISEHIGEFIDNLLYLLGLKINGVTISSLSEFIETLLDGSLYNSTNLIKIRDALAGLLKNIDELPASAHIKAVLKASLEVDLDAVAKVDIPEFSEDKDKFVEYLCDVLEPLYPVLKWALADDDISFFVELDKSDAITLKGAEGYAYGIIPLLELFGCDESTILTPAEYYDAVEENGDVFITSIIDPLLARIDQIIGEGANTADVILTMLPNIIYFINSNGVDTVVKNTLNAVYALLNAIEPIAKIDLYEIIGLDLTTFNFAYIVELVLDKLAEMGYEFENIDADSVAELTIGTLEQYTSVNGKTAYRMVFESQDSKGELVTIVLRLLVTFIAHENNQETLIRLLKDKLGMTGETEEFVRAALKGVCDAVTDTNEGMDVALGTIYYIYYGVDIAVDKTADSLKDVNNQWKELLKDLGASDDPNEATVGNLIVEILEGDLFGDIFEDILDSEGLAPNGGISFFQKIINWIKAIIEWFKGLFS